MRFVYGNNRLDWPQYCISIHPSSTSSTSLHLTYRYLPGRKSSLKGTCIAKSQGQISIRTKDNVLLLVRLNPAKYYYPGDRFLVPLLPLLQSSMLITCVGWSNFKTAQRFVKTLSPWSWVNNNGGRRVFKQENDHFYVTLTQMLTWLRVEKNLPRICPISP